MNFLFPGRYPGPDHRNSGHPRCPPGQRHFPPLHLHLLLTLVTCCHRIAFSNAAGRKSLLPLFHAPLRHLLLGNHLWHYRTVVRSRLLSGRRGTGRAGKHWPCRDYPAQVAEDMTLMEVSVDLIDPGFVSYPGGFFFVVLVEVRSRLEIEIGLGIYWHLQIISFMFLAKTLSTKLSHILKTSLKVARYSW